MELIVGIVIGIIIGIGLTSAPPWKWQKRKRKSNEWVNWRPVDERMETKEDMKPRATHNKIADEVTHTTKPKAKRNPRKNNGKRKYYKNKKKKVTKSS
jgi:hypothetical protein|tara:strand:+ start:331 stop:624 length:294 start_codon:yes stop_codon:yes gene_type:complete